MNQPEYTNSRALRPRVKGRLIAAATTSTGHPARSAMWAIATRSPLRLVVARAEVGRSIVMRRFHARGRGRAARVEKWFSHLKIVVAERAQDAEERTA